MEKGKRKQKETTATPIVITAEQRRQLTDIYLTFRKAAKRKARKAPKKA